MCVLLGGLENTDLFVLHLKLCYSLPYPYVSFLTVHMQRLYHINAPLALFVRWTNISIQKSILSPYKRILVPAGFPCVPLVFCLFVCFLEHILLFLFLCNFFWVNTKLFLEKNNRPPYIVLLANLHIGWVYQRVQRKTTIIASSIKYKKKKNVSFCCVHACQWKLTLNVCATDYNWVKCAPWNCAPIL